MALGGASLIGIAGYGAYRVVDEVLFGSVTALGAYVLVALLIVGGPPFAYIGWNFLRIGLGFTESVDAELAGQLSPIKKRLLRLWQGGASLAVGSFFIAVTVGLFWGGIYALKEGIKVSCQ